MRTLFLSLAILIAASAAYGQALPPPLPELTDLEEFSSRSGTLIQRDFTHIGEFSNLRVDAVKVSDVVAKTSVYGVRISGKVGPGASRDSAFLDAGEIGAFIKMIDVLRASAFATTPDNFTDLVYRTRGGISIGAIYADKRWTAALRLDRFDPRSAVSIDATDIDSLRALLVKAKESIIR